MVIIFSFCHCYVDHSGPTLCVEAKQDRLHSLEEPMSGYAIKLTTFGQHEEKKTVPSFGTVKTDKLASFTGMEGQAIRCTSGYLWVTLQDDVMDHVLRLDQSFTIPVTGKVVIGGKGCYAIEPATRMPLAS